MRFTNATVLASVIALTLGATAAETYTWIPGSTDWDSEDSYVEDGKPGQGDIVLIPAGEVATNKVVADDAASLASFEAFSKLYQVKLESNASKLVLDIGAGLVLTNNCRITCNAGNRTGLIVKRGLGSLEFGIQNNASAYNCGLNVEEGLLALPQNMTASAFYLGDVVVSNGATLVTALDSAHGVSVGAGPTYAGSLNGGGDITNRYGGSKRLGLNVSYRTSTFSGRIRRGVMIFPSASGQSSVVLNLTGVESDTSSPVYVSDYTTLGAAKFGLAGQPSSIGKVGSLYWRGAGTFKYLGDGEDVTDKNFYTWTLTDAPITIDAGKGPLRMTGELGCDASHVSEAYGMIRLTLTGEGVRTNVFAGTMPTWAYLGTNYNFHVTKTGTCVWRFADKAQTHAGAWTIANGTLQFESLKQRGVACSLGTSKNCLQSYTGLIDESKRVDWAFALGGASTPATLEYVGTSNVFCTTRPILLKGKGGTLKNSSDKPFVFGGVSSAAGESVALTLAGDTSATNEIWNVTDGEGTTSLVKDGSGTWALCGTNDFSGSVTVKNGTLVVKNLSEFNYDWFRFIIKERAQPSTASDRQNVRAVELGIYDAENKRMNGGLTTYASYGSKPDGTLPAGMAGYGHPNMPAERSDRPLSGLFEGGTSLWAQMGLPNGEPTLSETSTWVSVIMHLTNTTARAKTFDVAQRGDDDPFRYKTISMEGSLDGVHWDVLTNVTTSAAKSKWTFAASSVSAANSATHTGGCPIAGGPEGTANALEGVGASFSVAEGARLVAQGAATIPGLTIDADGAGTVEGFAFAENGTLSVKNMPRSGGVLPGAYVNCTGFENIGNWTLYDADKGRAARGYKLAVSNGTIRIIAPGAMLIVK
ncbi:MAG: autotransporter-associated beta strand repeat-containing protein [Kiritimatiellae bacterium]|nr:autotransporter-associated beta strand repeat-containing protein [Kiritimatiellia bacterium]